MDSQFDGSRAETTTDRSEGSTRRIFVKGGIAAVGGLALSTVYVKPSVTSVSFYDASFAKSTAPSVSASPTDPKDD